jgi:hypothetical protein
MILEKSDGRLNIGRDEYNFIFPICTYYTAFAQNFRSLLATQLRTSLYALVALKCVSALYGPRQAVLFRFLAEEPEKSISIFGSDLPTNSAPRSLLAAG